jgi:hypothetical protein
MLSFWGLPQGVMSKTFKGCQKHYCLGNKSEEKICFGLNYFTADMHSDPSHASLLYIFFLQGVGSFRSSCFWCTFDLLEV